MKVATAKGARVRTADFLPGELWIERGTVRDYRALAHFHYAPGDPATWAGVWKCVYREAPKQAPGETRNPKHEIRNKFQCSKKKGSKRRLRNSCFGFVSDFEFRASDFRERVVAVAVLSYPTLSSRARVEALGPRGKQREPAFLNRHVRTISRVIVHPQFRSLGIASQLVRHVCDQSRTRFVEAIAAMGRVHPLFERGGMRRVETGDEQRSYFIFDRKGVLS